MTVFLIICAAMLLIAVTWVVWPLQRRSAESESSGKADRHWASLAVVLLVPVLAAGLYLQLSDWDFDAPAQAAQTAQSTDTVLRQLEEKLRENPDDLRGWLLLGRSYTATGQFPLAVNAFERAYALSKGEDVEATIGLGEALALTDQTTLVGRAGRLFEQALQRAPRHPKALWYGGIAALQAGDLRLGRDRFALLLQQNPPAELRGLLERQVQDLNQQLGESTPAAASAAGSVTGERQIAVAVTLAPSLRDRVSADTPLFVIARDPAGGPPLAVQRRRAADLPLNLTLTEADAMMPQRSIATVERVHVIARLSRSGNPQAQSGDFYGEAPYEFGTDSGTLNIMIDQTVP